MRLTRRIALPTGMEIALSMRPLPAAAAPGPERDEDDGQVSRDDPAKPIPRAGG